MEPRPEGVCGQSARVAYDDQALTGSADGNAQAVPVAEKPDAALRIAPDTAEDHDVCLAGASKSRSRCRNKRYQSRRKIPLLRLAKEGPGWNHIVAGQSLYYRRLNFE